MLERLLAQRMEPVGEYLATKQPLSVRTIPLKSADGEENPVTYTFPEPSVVVLRPPLNPGLRTPPVGLPPLAAQLKTGVWARPGVDCAKSRAAQARSAIVSPTLLTRH